MKQIAALIGLLLSCCDASAGRAPEGTMLVPTAPSGASAYDIRQMVRR